MKILVALFLFSSTMHFCYAETVLCKGKVDKIGFHASNLLMLKLSSMNTGVIICNTEEEFTVPGTGHSTGPEMCKALLSMLMHAKAAQIDMGTVWFDGDNVPADCESWKPWAHANIRHFMY
ncbi:hypothetical protein [Bacterioplanoides sp.]|uniref:hypothetical protein n=1 Tax=Bacterioplanoides sp. TaxID=2066072 RepID=UPI003B00C995